MNEEDTDDTDEEELVRIFNEVKPTFPSEKEVLNTKKNRQQVHKG